MSYFYIRYLICFVMGVATCWAVRYCIRKFKQNMAELKSNHDPAPTLSHAEQYGRLLSSFEDYWIDASENKWSKYVYTFEEAVDAFLSLKNCTGCVNCSKCIKCDGCYSCSYCNKCSRCEDGFKLVDCGHCIKCDNCTGCINLNNSTRCYHAFNKSGLNK